MKRSLRSIPGFRGLALLAALLIGISGQAAAGDEIEINEIVVFGDSLSDTGNVFALTDLNPDFPIPIPASPTWFEGRFTNGPVWHEAFADGLGVMPQSLPAFGGGLNYAFGGAEYGSGFSATGTPNVGTQIDWYLSGIPPFPFLPVSPPGVPSNDQLFVINGANNDFIPPGPPADPRELADTVVDHITTLAAAGARHFLVPSSVVDETRPGLNPPLDAALFFPETPTAEAKQEILDSVRRFNRRLSFKLFRLERALNREYDEPVTITVLNLALAQDFILRRPWFFGIENVTDPALVFPPPESLPPGVGPTCFCVGAVPPGVDPELYFYFDIVHPTARVHEIFGYLALLNVRWKLALASRRY